MNETLSVIWPVATGVILVPVVAWIKTKIPVDFPLQAPTFSAVLSLALMWGLAQLFAPEMTWQQIITYALGSLATSQFGHAAKKTGVKIKTNGGTT